MNKSLYVIFISSAYRISRIFTSLYHIQILTVRQRQIKTLHICPRSHDRVYIFIIKFEYIVHKFILFGIYETALGTFIDKNLNLFAGINFMFVSDIMTHQLHNSVCDGIEQPHYRRRYTVKPHKRQSRKTGIFIR